jgi:hypothetical protein
MMYVKALHKDMKNRNSNAFIQYLKVVTYKFIHFLKLEGK